MFRWKSNDDPIAGWELKETWVKEDGKDDGIAKRGLLSLYYYSGDGKRLQGCRPNVNFRKGLLHMVFIKESDFRNEEFFSQPLTANQKKSFEKGVKYVQSYPGIFRDYIMCDKQIYYEVESKYTAGGQVIK